MRKIIKNKIRLLYLVLIVLLFGIVGCENEYFDVSNTNSFVASQETYKFRNESLLKEHFKKHAKEFPYETLDEYVNGANSVVQNPEALHKKEKEDNDDIYYLESTNEYVVISTDGYIRTYFKPDRGIKYYNSK